MSLLTIAQAVAEEVGVDSPTSIIGNSDRTARQLLRLINRQGRVLAKLNWVILQKENTFTTDGSAYTALPSDFGWLDSETVWDRDNFWKMRGPLSARDWQVFKSGLVATVASRLRFRVKPLTGVNKLYMDPTPSSGVDAVFEYVSNSWVTDSAGVTFKTAYAVDTDLSIISEELIEMGAIWRFKSAKGLAYAEEFNEYTNELEKAISRDGGKPIINMGGGPSMKDNFLNLPQSGFGS